MPTMRVTFGGGAAAAPAGQYVAECAPSATLRYNAAVNQLSAGRDAEAVALLDAVLAECPTHPHAPELRRLASMRVARAELNELRPPTPPSTLPPLPPSNPFAPEVAAPLSRGEIVSVQTASGLALGALACGVANCNDGRYYLAASLLGGGAGFAASFLATGGGITPGQALLVNSGMGWGYINAALVSGALSSGITSQSVAGAFLAGGVLGTGVGIIGAYALRPSAYRVAMANSGAFWLAGLTGSITLMAAGSIRSATAVFVPIMISANLGLIGGAVLGAYVPISRPRMLLIDTAGAVGMLTGLGLGMLLPNPAVSYSGFHPSEVFMGLGMVLGEVGGLALGYYLTRNFDGGARATPVQATLVPIGPEGRVGASLGVTF